MTVPEFTARWIEAECDLRHYLTWTAACAPGSDVPHATHARVKVDASDMAAIGMAPATVTRCLAALAGFYAFAVDEGHLDRSPAARVRRPTVGEQTTSTG